LVTRRAADAIGSALGTSLGLAMEATIDIDALLADWAQRTSATASLLAIAKRAGSR
jgi:hypothetical protein